MLLRAISAGCCRHQHLMEFGAEAELSFGVFLIADNFWGLGRLFASARLGESDGTEDLGVSILRSEISSDRRAAFGPKFTFPLDRSTAGTWKQT